MGTVYNLIRNYVNFILLWKLLSPVLALVIHYIFKMIMIKWEIAIVTYARLNKSLLVVYS